MFYVNKEILILILFISALEYFYWLIMYCQRAKTILIVQYLEFLTPIHIRLNIPSRV